MEFLSNENLIDTYCMAVHLKLDKEFIQLLRKELDRRNLQPDRERIKGA